MPASTATDDLTANRCCTEIVAELDFAKMRSNSNSIANEISSSAWSPFRHAIFAVIWTATVVSNIGGWMYSAASGWLMTNLNPDPLVVSLVQVATTLPVFLFAIPAGALADILDKRRFLIVGET